MALAANGVGVLAQDGRIAGEVSIPGPPGGVASGLGHIWVTDPSSNTVRVVDPASASVEGLPIRTGGSDPTGIAVLDSRVWIINSAQSQVAEVDPATGGVVRKVGVGNGARAIAAGDGAVWVANSADGTLQRIDAKTGRASVPIPVGAAPSAVAFGAASVWVTDEADGFVYRVNPHTYQVTRIPVGQSPESVAVGFGAVWVANATDNSVTRIALPSLSSRPIPVTAPSGIAVGAGGVWVASLEARNVVRIDPASRTVKEVIPTRNPPGPLTVADGRVWVTILSAPFSHRGGTLRLGLTSGIDSIDPAVAFTPLSWQMLANTNDGLVGYRRVGGGAGSVLVPDLATTLPTPAEGGRSYTFQLRRGVRYSTGAPVKASDLRFALERALADPQGPASNFLGAIAGASACGHHGKTCNLSKGVVTDDAAGTVTINLVRPDPDLIEALTLPFADFLPPGSPPASSAKPVPATGPYRVASYVPGRQVLLVRNPYFRQWSAEAQPAGFPDRIAWTLGISTPKQVRAVDTGRLDAALGNPDAPPDGPASVRLLQNHPDQVHLYTHAQITAFFLNTQLPPFTNLLARRAVNYALNRKRSLQVAGGRTTARITCQMLPPNIPGYRPYCPYTRRPGSGGWTAPDLTRARALAAASNTTQIPVTVHTGASLLGQARVLVAALRAVGYHAHLALESTPDYFTAIYTPSTRYQAGPWGYIDDYPAPSDFLRYQLGCHQALNVAHFCDHRIDALIDRAGRARGDRPLPREPPLGGRRQARHRCSPDGSGPEPAARRLPRPARRQLPGPPPMGHAGRPALGALIGASRELPPQLPAMRRRGLVCRGFATSWGRLTGRRLFGVAGHRSSAATAMWAIGR